MCLESQSLFSRIFPLLLKENFFQIVVVNSWTDYSEWFIFRNWSRAGTFFYHWRCSSGVFNIPRTTKKKKSKEKKKRRAKIYCHSLRKWNFISKMYKGLRAFGWRAAAHLKYFFNNSTVDLSKEGTFYFTFHFECARGKKRRRRKHGAFSR